MGLKVRDQPPEPRLRWPVLEDALVENARHARRANLRMDRRFGYAKFGQGRFSKRLGSRLLARNRKAIANVILLIAHNTAEQRGRLCIDCFERFDEQPELLNDSFFEHL